MKGKLIMTVEQAADRVAWERVRNSGIGGSDIACIMGLNPWKSAYALYAEKHGDVDAEQTQEQTQELTEGGKVDTVTGEIFTAEEIEASMK